MLAFKSRSAALAFAAALFFLATLTSPRPAYAADPPTDTGHFALEDKLDVMAPMIHDFSTARSARADSAGG